MAPCHNDLGAEPRLVDEAGAFHGVIDWTDAALTDPSVDLGRLLRDPEPEVVEPLLERLPYDAHLHARIDLRARCVVLEDLAYGLDPGDERYWRAALERLPTVFGGPRPPDARASLTHERPAAARA